VGSSLLALEKTDINDVNMFPTENIGDFAMTKLKIILSPKKICEG